jgi:hypothetical protein
VTLVAGCGSPDQKLTDAAAQAAREAQSEVSMTQVIVEQLQAHRIWHPTADRMVGDSEQAMDKAVSGFAGQQPSTDESRRLYEQVGAALDTAQQAVTATRIALGNDDLAAAVRQLDVLRRSADALRKIGELSQ